MPEFLRSDEQHISSVYGYLAYRLGSRSAAEKLTEATLRRAVHDRRWAALDPRDARVLVLRIAREASSDQRGAGGRDGDDCGIAPDLAEALDQLGREERSVLALRFGAQLPPREIARVLDVSEGGVRAALSRGLRRLRTELERRERTRMVTERGSVPPGLSRGHEQREHAKQDEPGREPHRGP